MNFWTNLPKPFVGLAPMDGITDTVERRIAAKYGKPDVMITEFTHVQGLWLGKMTAYQDLLYSEEERPLVAQLFGSSPEFFYKAAHIICELGFDGLDINMGCPANSVIKRGGGAALIKTPAVAMEIIRAAKKGVQDWVNGQTLEDLNLDQTKTTYIHNEKERHLKYRERQLIPVSVKTRIGYDKPVTKAWISTLIEAQPDAITIHGRTFTQLYSGTADWEAIGSVADLLHQHNIILIGNGDITSVNEAHRKARHYHCDGILIGRAALGNPWVFTNQKPTVEDRLKVMLEHADKFVDLQGEKRLCELYKHLGWYCKGFSGAKDLRINLITKTQSLQDIKAITEGFLNLHTTIKAMTVESA